MSDSESNTDTKSNQPKTLNPKWGAVIFLVALALGMGGYYLLSGAGDYTAEVKEKYVLSCVGPNADEQLCGCTFDSLKDLLSFADFEALDKRAAVGITTAEDNAMVTEIAFNCASKHKTL